MSTYSVSCECGRTHGVSAAQAGSELSCCCGRSIKVPRLSSLRTSAGETAIPLNIVERIRSMIRNGELPVGGVCPLSGLPADTTVMFHVQCERTWLRRGERMTAGKAAVYGLLFGWVGYLMAFRDSEPPDAFGRDTSVGIPLRVSSEVRARLLRVRRQRRLKSLLSDVPVYAELLREYPEATVTVMPTSSRSDLYRSESSG